MAYTVQAKMELPGVRGEDGEYETESRVLNQGDSITDEELKKHGQSKENISELIEQEALVKE
jgi:hypothetical protein